MSITCVVHCAKAEDAETEPNGVSGGSYWMLHDASSATVVDLLTMTIVLLQSSIAFPFITIPAHVELFPVHNA